MWNSVDTHEAVTRPEARLGLVCVALVAGEALGFAAGGSAAAWPVTGLCTVFVAVFGFARKWRLWHVAFFLLLGLSLAMRTMDVRHQALTEIGLRNGPYEDVFEVTGEARVGKEDPDGMRWVSFPTLFPGGELTVMMRASVTNAAPQVGELWRCAGWLARQGKDSGSRTCLWVRGHETHAACESPANPNALSVFLARVRRDLSHRLGIGLEDRPLTAGLHRAMLLGERGMLPNALRDSFMQAGTVHVFAISGLHVMVVAKMLTYALVIFMFPVRWVGVVLVPVLWLYVLMIGAPPSAVRAAAMASVYCVAPVFWRRPDGLTAWEVTLIGFALVDPVGLFGVGSVLSFSVMLGILLVLRWARPLASRLVVALGVPFAAWAAGVPIVAHFFGTISAGGLVANLATVPLAGVVVLTGAMGLLASIVSDVLAAHLNNLAALFTEAIAGISWAVARIPGANVMLEPWSVPMCMAWYVGIVLLFVLVRMVWMRRRGSIS